MYTSQPVQRGAGPDSVVLRLFIRRSGKPAGVNRQRATRYTHIPGCPLAFSDGSQTPIRQVSTERVCLQKNERREGPVSRESCFVQSSNDAPPDQIYRLGFRVTSASMPDAHAIFSCRSMSVLVQSFSTQWGTSSGSRDSKYLCSCVFSTTPAFEHTARLKPRIERS